MMPFRCPIRLVLLAETPRNARQLTTITVRIFLRRRDEPQSASECAPRHSFQQLCCLYLHPDGRGIRQRRGKDQRKARKDARRNGLEHYSTCSTFNLQACTPERSPRPSSGAHRSGSKLNHASPWDNPPERGSDSTNNQTSACDLLQRTTSLPGKTTILLLW